MTSLGTILIIGYVIVLAALFGWLLRRKAKARAAHRRRSAILAKIREQTDARRPILGWMVPDDAVSARPPRPVPGPY